MTDRARILLVGAVAPALIGLVGVVLILIALPTLPDPVAIHWGPAGADGFGPAWLNLVMLPLLIAAYCVFALVAVRGEGFAHTQRILLSTSPFLAVMLTVVLAGTLWLQRGLADARDMPGITAYLVGGILLSLVVAVAAWFALPRSSAPESVEIAAPSVDLGATERAVWMRRTGPSGIVTVLAVGSLVVVGVVAVVALAVSAPLVATLAYGALLVVISLLVASTLFWRVRVSEAGFLVRSVLGFPRFAVPLEDVDVANVVDLDPVREFGGWGIRWGGPGRVGVITRRGEALEVRRRNGKALVVTVGDAASGAGLLNSLVARRGTMA